METNKEITAQDVARWLHKNKDKIAIAGDFPTLQLQSCMWLSQTDELLLSAVPVPPGWMGLREHLARWLNEHKKKLIVSVKDGPLLEVSEACCVRSKMDCVVIEVEEPKES